MAPIDGGFDNQLCGTYTQANDPLARESVGNNHGSYGAAQSVAVGFDKTAPGSFVVI